jgi:hypothetical protein
MPTATVTRMAAAVPAPSARMAQVAGLEAGGPPALLLFGRAGAGRSAQRAARQALGAQTRPTVGRYDVRHGSVKRVASAVGEGAIAIQLVHEYLRHRDRNYGLAGQGQ